MSNVDIAITTQDGAFPFHGESRADTRAFTAYQELAGGAGRWAAEEQLYQLDPIAICTQA